MKIRKLILAALATAVLLVPTVIWAADHFGRGDMGAGPFGMGGSNVLRLADRLGLSSDQVMQVKGILAAARTTNQPTRDQLKANRQAFKASYNPAQFDANAVNAYLAQQTPLVQQLVVTGFQTQAKVLAVLTPSQLTQFNQVRAQFGELWRSRPGRE
jgi:Spy/CpxP family protein refolding chaperone